MKIQSTQIWNQLHRSKMASYFTQSRTQWNACHATSCAILAARARRRPSAGIASTLKCEILFQKRQTTKVRSNAGHWSVAPDTTVPTGTILTRKKSIVNSAQRVARMAAPDRVILSGIWDAMHAPQWQCRAIIMARIIRLVAIWVPVYIVDYQRR